jgi:hypothetical protein
LIEGHRPILANWWTREDTERFTALTDDVVAQYDQVEVRPGAFAAEELTKSAHQGRRRVVRLNPKRDEQIRIQGIFVKVLSGDDLAVCRRRATERERGAAVSRRDHGAR